MSSSSKANARADYFGDVQSAWFGRVFANEPGGNVGQVNGREFAAHVNRHAALVDPDIMQKYLRRVLAFALFALTALCALAYIRQKRNTAAKLLW